MAPQLLARRRVSFNRNVAQKTLLTLLLVVMATILLWLGLERVHSAPAGPASPATWTAIPEVKLEGVPAEALIGESFKFKATFDNVGTGVGYGGFIDIVLPAYGKDGNIGGPCDGISISPSVGAMMVNVNGGPLPVTTYQSLTTPCGAAPATVTHPFSSSGVSPVVVPAGGQLITLELPFGSFEPDQPKIEVEITVDLHNYADVGLAGKLTIFARGGFHFGTTPLNDYVSDLPIVTDAGVPSSDNGTTPSIASAWVEKKDVIPTVFTVSKTYLGPEGEAVSGPNFVGYYPLQYQVTVNVAAGQTVTQLKIEDCLENNMSFVGLVPASTTPAYTGLVTSPCLQMTYPSVTGTASAADVVVTYEFYITQFVANSETPVLDPKGCSNTTSTNKAKATAQWTPLDPRDILQAGEVSSGTKYVLADKHIAIQKSVKVKVPVKKTLVDKVGLPIPGDYLEYKLGFQISDFFTFGQIEIEDILSDGQDIMQTIPAGPATIRVTDRFGTSQGQLTDSGSNADFEFEKTSKVNCQGVKGGTRILFKVSQAMINLSPSLPRHNLGIMTGGHAFSAVSSVPAEGEITFYVQIQDEFTYNGDQITKYVDKHDLVDNCVVISGRIYENTKDDKPQPLENKDSVCSDDSGTSLMIKPDVLRKDIIARNGKAFKKVVNPPPPKFAAGDTITFRISKTIPSGDWEHITVQDWAPLPALSTNSLIFPATIPSCGGIYPTTGNVCLGPNDNVGQPIPIGGMVHNADNSFTFDYGTQNNPANTPKTIEFWFTLTLTNDPYADGLFFTNEVQECEFNTFGVKFCQVAVARFELTEPSLKITKGVVWAGNPNTNPGAAYNPSQAAPTGVMFSGPGLPCATRFAGTINSAKLVSPISSDVSGVDAGDLVLFAIVVENRGSGLNGAFDIKVSDTLPVGLTLVTTSPICVAYGNNVPISTSLPLTDLFTPVGLELTDPLSQGALAPYDALPTSNGLNVAVITFYAQVDQKIKANCYPNRAELLNYATTEGGPSFVTPAAFGGPFTDVASVCVLPKAEKCVTTTSEPHTQPDNSTTLVPPQPPKVAIGEIVRYHLWVTIPEGISSGFFITDSLPGSMTYMNDGTTKVMFRSNTPIISSVSAVANLTGVQSPGTKSTCTGPKPIAVLPASQITPGAFTPGVAPSFTLGTLTNNDADADAEYVIVEFNALVNNLPINVSALPNMDGVTLSNSYKVFIKGAPTPAATSNIADVKILEPKLKVVKSASPTSVLPNGIVTFTVNVTNIGTTDAFDVLITDPPVSGLSILGPGTVSSSCSTPTLNTTNGTVTVPQIPMGCTVTRKFEAKVTAACPTASVTNTVYATYSSLPGTGTPIGATNQTGSVTPGASGAVNGERQYQAQGSVTVPLICTGSLAVTKIVNNLTSVPTPTGAIFPITVSCLPSGPNTTFNLAAGGTQTLPNIPVGSTCTVTEGTLPAPMPHPACASLEWSTTPTFSPGPSVSITTAGATVAVQVQNTYFCNKGCAKPPANMVGWWPLNETAGATVMADIMGGHNGTPMPSGSLAAINAAPGKVGGSLFITNNNVTVPDSPALQFGTSNFSIDAWFGSSQPQLVGSVVDKLDIPAQRGYALFVQGNRLKLVLGNGTAFTIYTSVATVGITNAMSWHHLAVTIDRVNALGIFYIDGVGGAPFSILPAVANISTTSTLLLGGSRQTFPTCVCEFNLDEVEIFNSVVPASAIQSIFKADKNGKCTATIKGMKFNDLDGNGVSNTGEPGLANWTIKATDSSSNIQTTTTNLAGNYSFTVPAPGTYTVSEVLVAGWTQTAPTSGTYAVTVAPGQVVVNRDFGNKKSLKNQCDLKITKTMKPIPVVSGQQATAYITVTNVGSGPCHGPTQVAESMPPAMTLISANVPGGSCVVATGVCTYAPGIPAGGSVVFTYVFNVTAQPGTSFENCAKVKNSEDQNQLNNGICIPLNVSGVKLPDLTIKKQVNCSGHPLQPICQITLTILNNGPGAFNGILNVQDVVTPPPSPGLSFSGPPPVGWSCTIGPSNTIACSGNSPVSLASGQSTSLTGSVMIPGGQYKNCASVKGYSQLPFNSSTLVQEANANNNQHCVPMP